MNRKQIEFQKRHFCSVAFCFVEGKAESVV